MAIKGLSIPVFAKYHNNNGNVTYTDGIINPHAVEYGMEVEAGDSNPLYADNKIQEDSAGTFSSGTLTLTVDDLIAAVSKYLLGLKEISRTVGGNTVKELIYDDDMNSPYLGVGLIEEHQIDNINHYRAVIIKKVKFNIPAGAATTRGESVEWQTKEITGMIQRSDSDKNGEKYPWMGEAWFTSEADAIAYLKSMLSVSDANASLTAFSVASETGTIDQATGNISVEVDAGTDVTDVAATFTAAAGAKVYVNGVEQTSGTTKNDFTNPVTYTVVASNGINQKSYVVNVTVAE